MPKGVRTGEVPEQGCFYVKLTPRGFLPAVGGGVAGGVRRLINLPTTEPVNSLGGAVGFLLITCCPRVGFSD